MNKKEFIKKLSEITKYDENKCILINNIIDNHFIIGKNNKEKIIIDLMNNLSLTKEEANKLYNIIIEILFNEVKEKLKHPFKSID